MDFETDRYMVSEQDIAEIEYEKNIHGWHKVVYTLKSFFV
jgi:hypothetical protein